jgi:hypothetical protein
MDKMSAIGAQSYIGTPTREFTTIGVIFVLVHETRVWPVYFITGSGMQGRIPQRHILRGEDPVTIAIDLISEWTETTLEVNADAVRSSKCLITGSSSEELYFMIPVQLELLHEVVANMVRKQQSSGYRSSIKIPLPVDLDKVFGRPISIDSMIDDENDLASSNSKIESWITWYEGYYPLPCEKTRKILNTFKNAVIRCKPSATEQ